MTATWQLTATCRHCGGQLTRVNGTEIDGKVTVAIDQCVDCERQWELRCTITPHISDGRWLRQKARASA